MAEYSTSIDQVVNPGESVLFDQTVTPCIRGFVRHREGSGNFLLSGAVPSCGGNRRRNRSARYCVGFGGNIAVNTGGTAGAITLNMALDGSTLPDTLMEVTPAAVEEFFNVGTINDIDVWNGCCETITVRNTSDQPVLVRAGAHISFSRPDLAITY